MRSRRSTKIVAAVATAVAAVLLAAGAVAAEEGTNDHDPWERMNRAVFSFNDTLDVYFLEPVAKGWDFIVPDLVERSLDNVIQNSLFPVNFINSLLQGKPRDGFDTLSRFVLNSTFGVAGMFDPATQIGLTPPREDFGQTLGRWGVGPGPYLVLPVLGPSDPRDACGLAVDSTARVWPWFVPLAASVAVSIGTGINTRSLYLDEIATAKSTALDYYAMVRNAFLQRREALIADRLETEEEDEDDLYYYDFDE